MVRGFLRDDVEIAQNTDAIIEPRLPGLRTARQRLAAMSQTNTSSDHSFDGFRTPIAEEQAMPVSQSLQLASSRLLHEQAQGSVTRHLVFNQVSATQHDPSPPTLRQSSPSLPTPRAAHIPAIQLNTPAASQTQQDFHNPVYLDTSDRNRIINSAMRPVLQEQQELLEGNVSLQHELQQLREQLSDAQAEALEAWQQVQRERADAAVAADTLRARYEQAQRDMQTQIDQLRASLQTSPDMPPQSNRLIAAATNTNSTTHTSATAQPTTAPTLPAVHNIDGMSQLTTAMTQAFNALAVQVGQASHAANNMNSSRDTFKVDTNKLVPTAMIHRGQYSGSALVLHIIDCSRQIEQAAFQAARRDPETPQEFAVVFRFFNSHLSPELRAEMQALSITQQPTSYPEYWKQLLGLFFTGNSAAMTAIQAALDQYLMWQEPSGLQRWEDVTRMLLEHHCQLRYATLNQQALTAEVHERMFVQLYPSLDRITSTYRPMFLADYHRVQNQLAAKQQTDNMTAADYQAACREIMNGVRRAIQQSGLLGTFGTHTQPQQVRAMGVPQHLAQTTNTDSTGKPPYSIVVTEGGVGFQGQTTSPSPSRPYGSQAAKHGISHNTSANTAGANQTPRLWGPFNKTADGRPLTGPVPAQAAQHKAHATFKGTCLGDWLVHVGLCTYCGQHGHDRYHCQVREARMQSWAAAKQATQAASQSENAQRTA